MNTRGGAYPGCSLSWSYRGSCSQGPNTSTPFITHPPCLLHLQHRQWETSRDQRSRVGKSAGTFFYCCSPRNEREVFVCVCSCVHFCPRGSAHVYTTLCVCYRKRAGKNDMGIYHIYDNVSDGTILFICCV